MRSLLEVDRLQRILMRMNLQRFPGIDSGAPHRVIESQHKSCLAIVKVNHLGNMNEEEIEARFEEIRNQLKAQKEQLDAFKEDLMILFKHRSIASRDILDTAQQLGNSAFDQSDVHKCQEFLKKYEIRRGF